MAGRPKGQPKTGGRKKGTRNKATADVKVAAQEYTTEALEVLAEVMRDKLAGAARVAASKELLDRGHGKAHQTSEATVTVKRTVVRAPSPSPDADSWRGEYAPAVH